MKKEKEKKGKKNTSQKETPFFPGKKRQEKEVVTWAKFREKQVRGVNLANYAGSLPSHKPLLTLLNLNAAPEKMVVAVSVRVSEAVPEVLLLLFRPRF